MNHARHLRPSGHRSAWLPGHGGGHVAVRAGVWWDAIRVRQETAHRVLETLRTRLGRPAGPVIADPRRVRAYILVPPTTADDWDVPDTRALGRASYVVVPHASIIRPPGPYWMVPPDTGWHLTSPGALREALQTVTGAP